MTPRITETAEGKAYGSSMPPEFRAQAAELHSVAPDLIEAIVVGETRLDILYRTMAGGPVGEKVFVRSVGGEWVPEGT